MSAICPECKTPLPDGRLDGLCPQCFLDSALSSDPEEEGLLDAAFGSHEESGNNGLRLPGLEVAGEISRGGMGIIYRARQRHPEREVAVKILKPQFAGNDTVRERFRRESRSLANLDHPHILPVYAVGEVNGLPWFSMKMAAGGALADRIRDHRGNWRETAELVLKLARALAFAHERGVLHRDIKPGNILFDAENQPFLADFGLAKQLGVDSADHSLTLEADVLGTPNYLAPEVASGSLRSATTTVDVYSLGAVLYELLSGEPPHRAENLPALLRRVADSPPRPLSGFSPMPPVDLRSICEKAMAVQPGDRYQSARDFADDLQRYLEGGEIQARQSTLGEAMWRWSRRHPAVAALVLVIVLLLGTLVVGSGVALVRIGRAERAARAERDKVQAGSRLIMLAEAEGVRRARFPDFREHAIRRVQEARAPDESSEMRLRRRSEAMAALAFPVVTNALVPQHEEGWHLRAVSEGHEFLAWMKPGKPGWRVTSGRDGRLLSESPAEGIPRQINTSGRWMSVLHGEAWSLWDISGPEAKLHLKGPGTLEDLSPDGRLMACTRFNEASEGVAEVRDTRDGAVLFSVLYPTVTIKMRFRPDGAVCAMAPSFYLNFTNFPYSVRTYRCDDGRLDREFSSGMGNCIWSMAWSRDGSHLAASERGGITRIWDSHSGNVRHVLTGVGTELWRIAFSHDNRHMAGIGADRLFTIFDMVSGQPVFSGPGWFYPETPGTLSWSNLDPRVCGPVSVGGKPAFFKMEAGAFSTYLPVDSHGSSLGIAVSPNDRWLVVGDSRNARIWDLNKARKPVLFATDLWNSFAFSPDGSWLFGAGEAGAVRWRMDEAGVVTNSRTQLVRSGLHNFVTRDEKGDVLAVENEGHGKVSLFFDPTSENPVRRDVPSDLDHWIALSPDGERLAATGRQGLRVWKTSTGEKLLDLKLSGYWVEFSRDGRWLVLAITQQNGRIAYEIWDAAQLKHVRILASVNSDVDMGRTAFSPDGLWLATGHAFGRISLWRAGSWERIGFLESPNRLPVGRMAFSSDGSKIFSTSTGGVVQMWDLVKLREGLRPLDLDW